jgi:hypothetical protein
MCTVSVLKLADAPPGASVRGLWFAGPAAGFRMACNRDERDERPAALPPRIAAFGGRLAILPTDPQGGGTWIAVNEAGLALALLNLNTGAGGGSTGRLSRGRIIPALLGCADVEEAAAAAARLHPQSYAPFRLVLTDGAGLAEIVCGRRGLLLRRGLLPDRPLLFTASGLGDGAVEAPRRALFEEMFARGGEPVGVQDAFHGHAWPDRPHLSVRMRRPGAGTVSRTVVTVLADAVRMEYAPEGAPAGAGPHRLVLRRPRTAAA